MDRTNGKKRKKEGEIVHSFRPGLSGTLSLRTFDSIGLHRNTRVLKDILYIFVQKKLLRYSMVAQPRRKKHATLLRSPHIDKKSREQYLEHSQKLVFHIHFRNSKSLEVFYSTIEKNLFKGATFGFEWKVFDYFFPRSLRHALQSIERT